MPYYAAGDYYRGDYYRGDFLGIGKALKKVVGVASGVVSKLGIPVVSGIAGQIHGLAAGGTVQPPLQPSMSLVPLQTAQRGLVNIGGGGSQTGIVNIGGQLVRVGKRKRMNPMNVRALRRASRRIDGFVRTARGALKHTQYVLTRRGGRGGSSRGVITRAEAARALRK